MARWIPRNGAARHGNRFGRTTVIFQDAGHQGPRQLGLFNPAREFSVNRFKRYSLFAAIVIASIWTASGSAFAQQTAPKPPAIKTEPVKVDVVLSTRDSVTIADVQKAADQLVIAVQEAVRKTTEDPALKVAVLKVAKNAVVAAQVAITQQAEMLQTVLESLAREIAQATERQQSRARRH